MFNSRNLGALIVNEKPHVKSWDEPQYSIQNIAIEESYGSGVLNEDRPSRLLQVQTPLGGISTPKALDIPSRLHFTAQTSSISGGLSYVFEEVDTAGARSSPQVATALGVGTTKAQPEQPGYPRHRGTFDIEEDFRQLLRLGVFPLAWKRQIQIRCRAKGP